MGKEINMGPQESPEKNVTPSSAMCPGTLLDQAQGKNQTPKDRITVPLRKGEEGETFL